MHPKNKLLTLIAILIFLIAGQILAQSDETYTGDIENDRDKDEYVITINEGDGVIITAIAPDGSELDTFLTLFKDDGNIVAYNDDYEFPESTNSQIAYTPVESGDYTVVIGNYPRSIGEYELLIEYISPADGIIFNETVNLLKLLGEPDLEFTGFMSDDVYDDEYKVELIEGQSLVVIAEATTNSDLDTYLILFNEDNDEVARNDDSEPDVTFNSRIVYTADESGEYTIVLSNYPQSAGNYVLRVYYVSEDVAQQIGGTPNVDIADLVAEPDVRFTGFMSDDVPDFAYEVKLEIGDSIIITAEAAYASGLDTILFLLDDIDEVVAYNDDRDANGTLDSRIVYTADQSGDYTIILSNYPESAGDYILNVYNVSQDIAEQITGRPHINILEVIGEPDLEFSGFMSDDVAPAEYTIALQAGQGVVVTASTALGNFLDTFLVLRNVDGEDIVVNDDIILGVIYDSLIGFVAEETNTYTIVVGNYPNSSGNYIATVTYVTPEQVQQVHAITNQEGK